MIELSEVHQTIRSSQYAQQLAEMQRWRDFRMVKPKQSG